MDEGKENGKYFLGFGGDIFIYTYISYRILAHEKSSTRMIVAAASDGTGQYLEVFGSWEVYLQPLKFPYPSPPSRAKYL